MDEANTKLIDTLGLLQRDIAVLSERVLNEQLSRTNFAQLYEVRHKELQLEVAALEVRFNNADADRYAMKEDMRHLREDVSGISANIRWVVYLILGLVITAIVGMVIGGALGRVRVN